MERKVIRLFFLFLACSYIVQAQEKIIPDRQIRFSSGQGTVYEILNQITEQSGFCFIYDSEWIDNEKKVAVPEGTFSLREAVRLATDEKGLQMKLIGQHILLYKEKAAEIPAVPAPKLPSPSFLTIEGSVIDAETGKPLVFSSIEIYKMGIGTITNQNGRFMLKLPDSLLLSSIQVSHLGYEPRVITTESLTGKHTDIKLQTRSIPLEEVIVRLVNPIGILQEMLEKREVNYANAPVFLTSFYREGIEKGKGFLSLTEGVFKIYKTGCNSTSTDQVKLLKMRHINNQEAKDSLIMKIKSGIGASLDLDLMKDLPDFLSPEQFHLYNYSKIDMCVIDSHLAHVIAFEQKKNVQLALFKGELYIDAENSALLSVRMEINPEHISKTEDIFVLRKSKKINITPKKIVYTISYKLWRDKYYINHVRGDLDFRIKRKGQLFYSPVHTWFEMVTCGIDTAVQAKRFPGKESIPVNKVFSETRFKYDKDFWGDFNIILPEDKMNEAILKINSRITETE